MLLFDCKLSLSNIIYSTWLLWSYYISNGNNRWIERRMSEYWWIEVNIASKVMCVCFAVDQCNYLLLYTVIISGRSTTAKKCCVGIDCWPLSRLPFNSTTFIDTIGLHLCQSRPYCRVWWVQRWRMIVAEIDQHIYKFWNFDIINEYLYLNNI